jgi:hypothetical protein
MTLAHGETSEGETFMSDSMHDSILKTIRAMIGPSASYDIFDTDLIVHINSSLMELTQLGVGPEEGFYITGEEETWSDFLDGSKQLEAVKTLIYLEVRNVFDPPSNSFVLEANNKRIEEYKWRLEVKANAN